METNLLKQIPNFSSTGFWVSKKGAIGATIIGFVVAESLIILDCIPSVSADPNGTTTQWWNIIAVVSGIILPLISWLIATQIYLRKGRGAKIGLAYDGYPVKREDWNRIRNILRNLFKNGKIKNQVSLRFVPVRTTNIDRYTNKYMKRYGFTILVAIQQSPHIKENNPKHDQYPFFPEISLRLTEVVEQQFVETTLKHTFQIVIQRTKTIKTLANVLEARARNLHDMMLLLIAALCYREQKYEDCATISRHLDQSLSSIMGPSQETRRQVRLLDTNSRLRPSEVSVRNLPPPDELMAIRDFAETAICYFDDFPAVAIGISRIRFLTGDVPGTIELTERFGGKIEEIRKAGQNPTDKVLAVYFLNSGFLSFIQGHWVNAYNAYREMLSVDAYRNENWPGIIDFIDYVADLKCYDGICYLQTLYRLIARRSVPNELRTAAQDWLNQDDSRKELRALLSRNYPSLAKKSEETAKKPEQKQRKIKQRSKRKGKGRKKKRR